MYAITLVSSTAPLTDAVLEQTAALLGASAAAPVWLSPARAADMATSNKPDPATIRTARESLRTAQIDLFVTPHTGRHKKLLLADMDSTIVTGETLDELAACAGIGKQVATITARAMRGELDFPAALRERVGLLRGLPEARLAETLARGMLNPGAEILVRTMKKHGATCVLVSGGFTVFTETFAQQAGFDFHHGNILHVANGALTGTVGEPILDRDSKLDFLQHYCTNLGIAPEDVLAIGDGANDLPMLRAAGLGIGYRPKPLLEDALDNCILYGDLTAALYAQGYTDAENIQP